MEHSQTARLPCEKVGDYFTNSKLGSPAAEYAKQLCTTCPALKQCALAALHGGDSLDGGYTRPATGVVQAGIYCRGDDYTAELLAAIAGVDIPDYHDHDERVNYDECRSCQAPMLKWQPTGQPVPNGWVVHYARGYCTNCRSSYKTAVENAAVEFEPAGAVARGIICQDSQGQRDKNHDGAVSTGGQPASQLPLF